MADSNINSRRLELYKNRPISPHLSIYKWHTTSSLSILHRLTGVGLYLGAVLLLWWLSFTIIGNFCDCAFKLINSMLAKIGLFMLSYGLFYHLINGIRHVFWDFGYGFSKNAIDKSAYFVIAASVSITLGFWLI